MHEPRIVSLAIMGVTGHRHRSHIPRSPRGITSRGLTRSDDLSPASWELLPCFAAKVRHRHNRTLSKLPSAMKLLPHNATCHEACHSYHLIFHGTVMAVANSPNCTVCTASSRQVLRYRSRPIFDQLTSDLIRITYPWQQAQAQRPWPKR